MDKDQRRELGAHYTSEENILRVINPLFMNDLWEEFEREKTTPQLLDRFHDKIRRLKFLDPACGCGNFLIITYRELRLLELEILKMKVNSNQLLINITPLLKITVEQFFGIEYEDFPCQIAQVGMWLMDHQMNTLVAEHFGLYYARLPLTQSATIVNGNALRTDWETVVPKQELSYILGNPPFVGKKEQTKAQKADLVATFGEENNGVGNLDYVTAWYYKAAKMIQNTAIRTAFVSTNSITQGEQVPVLWRMLLPLHVSIIFAYKTFKWSNEAKGKAAVHCVIIGFACSREHIVKRLYNGERSCVVQLINPYLMDAPIILISSRSKPICNVPEMIYGSMPIDDNQLILTEADVACLLAENLENKKFIRDYAGGQEILQGKKRWCLWLKGFDPADFMGSKLIMQRIEATRKFRLQSARPQTAKLAETPHLFGEIRQPSTPVLVIPKVSSEDRRYIPITWVEPTTIINGSALMIPGANLFHFGVLSSNVHMAWMRRVAGRMKSDFQYSTNNVYNNFPWPTPTQEQISVIVSAAQGVLTARAGHSNVALAKLYKSSYYPLFNDLSVAHKKLDKAVWSAYGANWNSEDECVADLMQIYQKLVDNK